MGRKKIHTTKEQQDEQARLRSKRYYEKNKKQICEKRMRRYLRSKEQD
jgi:hypothetical protein